MPTPTPTTDVANLPYLTADQPGTGGVIKRFDEDFIVEELPRYEASGEGTHVYFTIEKRGLTTHAANWAIARALGRKANDIGYAGLKDAHGITRQRLSVEHVDPEQVRNLAIDRLRVLEVTRHTNKIKLGHLAGNRFEIRIRDVYEAAEKRARVILDVLARRGVPNYFGPQRFGVRGDNAAVGRAVLRGDFQEALALMLGRPTTFDNEAITRARTFFDAGEFEAAAEAWPPAFRRMSRLCKMMLYERNPKRVWRAVDHPLRKLFVSAVQSELFNDVLARRLDTIDQLLDGDIAYRHDGGATFAVPEAAREQPRCDSFEISPTGPLFGKRMRDPEGEPARHEEIVLHKSGLDRAQMQAQDGKKLDGARRPLRVPLGAPTVDTGQDQQGAYLRLAFVLPPGAYATCVTREVCKPGSA